MKIYTKMIKMMNFQRMFKIKNNLCYFHNKTMNRDKEQV